MNQKITMIALIEVDKKAMMDNGYTLEEEFKWLADSGISLKNLVNVPFDFDMNNFQQLPENESMKRANTFRNQSKEFYER